MAGMGQSVISCATALGLALQAATKVLKAMALATAKMVTPEKSATNASSTSTIWRMDVLSIVIQTITAVAMECAPQIQ